MGLKAKIFTAFSLIVFGLLGLVLYVTTSQTEAFEVERITRQLGFAQARFQNRLDDQRRHAFTMLWSMKNWRLAVFPGRGTAGQI